LVLFGVFQVCLARDLRKAYEIADELVHKPNSRGSTEHIAIAAGLSAFAKMASGDFQLAAQCYDREWALWESIAKLAPARAQTRDTNAPTVESGVKPHYLGIEPVVHGLPGSRTGASNIATAIANESGENWSWSSSLTTLSSFMRYAASSATSKRGQKLRRYYRPSWATSIAALLAKVSLAGRMR